MPCPPDIISEVASVFLKAIRLIATMSNVLRKSLLISLICFLFAVSSPSLFSQDTKGKKEIELNFNDRRAREMSLNILDEMEKILRKYYYDPNMRGIDLKARIEEAKTRVKSRQHNWQMYRVFVQVLLDFDDSHTRVILPPRPDHFEYGFGLQMVGSSCVVTSVQKDSDAYKQGLRVGDVVLTLGRFTPNRRDLWKMLEVIYKLDPVNVLDLRIRGVDNTERVVSITAATMTDKEFQLKMKARKEARRAKIDVEPFKCQEISPALLACKLYSFSVRKNDIDKMITQALKYPKLILDMRGNHGGYVYIEQYLLSHFFDRQVKIADLVTREKTETRMTKPLGDRQYKGELAVLIDSESASAAEMTARVIQLEKRGKVYGDVSSGSVMTSIALPFTSTVSSSFNYAIIKVGMSVTIADVIMRDGSRLEKTGVIPDEFLVPTGIAFARKTDPVLAVVAQVMGASLTAEKAGSFYFIVPKEEDYLDEEPDEASGEPTSSAQSP